MPAINIVYPDLNAARAGQPRLRDRPPRRSEALPPSLLSVRSPNPLYNCLSLAQLLELLRMIVGAQPARQIRSVNIEPARHRVLSVPHRSRVIRPKVVPHIPGPAGRQLKSRNYTGIFVKAVVNHPSRFLKYSTVEHVELPPGHPFLGILVFLFRKGRILERIPRNYVNIGVSGLPLVVQF